MRAPPQHDVQEEHGDAFRLARRAHVSRTGVRVEHGVGAADRVGVRSEVHHPVGTRAPAEPRGDGTDERGEDVRRLLGEGPARVEPEDPPAQNTQGERDQKRGPSPHPTPGPAHEVHGAV